MGKLELLRKELLALERKVFDEEYSENHDLRNEIERLRERLKEAEAEIFKKGWS